MSICKVWHIEIGRETSPQMKQTIQENEENLVASAKKFKWASLLLLQSQDPQQFFFGLKHANQFKHVILFVTKKKQMILEGKTDIYFTQRKACCTLCYASKRTIFLFKHHLPRPCTHFTSEDKEARNEEVRLRIWISNTYTYWRKQKI